MHASGIACSTLLVDTAALTHTQVPPFSGPRLQELHVQSTWLSLIVFMRAECTQRGLALPIAVAPEAGHARCRQLHLR
jgi:hypothetical protein